MGFESMNQEPHLLTDVELPPPPPPKRPTAVGYEEYFFPPGLTPRETDILRLAVAGLDNQQISRSLGTTLRNVEKYILRLQTKVGMHSEEFPLNQILKNRVS
ncbi:MAG: helix-turn-helix transcriptional regulator [Leptolyngbya sp. SIO3F4]|nr:helix-turn-helix transcriptional regulator [Leptolyngbya sp. SIO3F4]